MVKSETCWKDAYQVAQFEPFSANLANRCSPQFSVLLPLEIESEVSSQNVPFDRRETRSLILPICKNIVPFVRLSTHDFLPKKVHDVGGSISEANCIQDPINVPYIFIKKQILLETVYKKAAASIIID